MADILFVKNNVMNSLARLQLKFSSETTVPVYVNGGLQKEYLLKVPIKRKFLLHYKIGL